MTTIIEVAETRPPQNGKKLAKVKTKTGEEFGIWPHKLQELRVGGRYDVEITENEFKGRTYRKITKADLVEDTSSNRAASDAEQQFVAAVLSAAIAEGKVPIETGAMVNAIKAVRAAWANTFGA